MTQIDARAVTIDGGKELTAPRRFVEAEDILVVREAYGGSGSVSE
ncbi:MAG: hypothetical protein WBN92_21590 [Terriglobia bacterium]